MSTLSNSFRNSGRRLTRGRWAVLGVVILSDLCGIAAITLGYFDIGRTLIGLSLVAIAAYRYWTRRTNRPVAAEVGAKNAGLVRADERQDAMELVLDPKYVRIWAATSSAIDAAAGQRP